HAGSEFQRYQRAGGEMALACADAAAQIQFGDGEAEILTQVGCDENDVARKLQTRIAALTNYGNVRIGICRFKQKLFAIDAAGWDFFQGYNRINARISLRGGDSQFARELPAPNLLCVQEMLQESRGCCGLQAAERFHSLQADIA